jgi:hypothetical protein
MGSIFQRSGFWIYAGAWPSFHKMLPSLKAQFGIIWILGMSMTTQNCGVFLVRGESAPPITEVC